MAVWLIPKFGTEMLEFRDMFWTVHGLFCVDCIIIYALNCGLGIDGPEMTMDFGSTKWNRCLVRGLPTDSPLHGCGTVKKSLGLLVGPKMVHVCCKQNIA